MWNTANGQEKRVDYYMWAKADTANGISAMARVTGISAAIGARLVGMGEVQEKGIIAPEDGIAGDVYQKFLNNLENRGIVVKEVVGSI